MVIEPCSVECVRSLCERYHGYASVGNVATYAFSVMENGIPVAAYSWQPPPPGAAKSVCVEEPSAVLALSRMVAVPKSDRELKHVSKPLKKQMRYLIDRTRWPVLVTFSDEGQGHTGYVYECSGWKRTTRTKAIVFEDEQGRRTSSYSNGVTGSRQLKRAGHTYIQRWEHWICEPSEVSDWLTKHGWFRTQTGRRWKSGNVAYRWMRYPWFN